MTKKSTYLFGILLTILIGTILYYYLCCTCSTCCNKTPEVATSTTPTEVQKGIFALKGKNIDYHCNNNFNFLNNNFKTILPVTDSIDIGIENLKTFLAKEGQKINITGYCLASEKNNSAFENLGLARAVDVKNYFVSKGISAASITTNGVVKENLNSDATTIYGPVDFLISEISAKTPKEDFTALKEKINANPLILYFNTGQTSIDLSVDDRKKVADMVHYLDNVADAKISATGFTDNVGKPKTNIILGKDRADFAKNYLVSNGIATNKIDSESKGPESPIATNETSDGRAKNRRTELKIK